jgi:hypothetical protein
VFFCRIGLILPDWGGMLRNYYWQLRYLRPYDQAARRRYYRLIAVEKKRLHEEGVDFEEVRLFCRWMANPRNQSAEQRFLNYSLQGRLFA